MRSGAPVVGLRLRVLPARRCCAWIASKQVARAVGLVRMGEALIRVKTQKIQEIRNYVVEILRVFYSLTGLMQVSFPQAQFV